MVRVEMLAVGKELLIGRTLNTNAHWAGKRLARMGTMLKEITTVDDDLTEIASAFRAIVRRSPDFLVVVGGLGPTPDDMTLEGIAKGLGVKVSQNDRALELIRQHYIKRGLQSFEMTPSRLKMAGLPLGAEPMVNEFGTAPGVRIVTAKTVVYCLPGVPKEMRGIFHRSVEPEVRRKLGKLHRAYVKLKLEGVFESALAPLISDQLRRHPRAYIKSHPRGTKEGVSRIELDIAVVESNSRAADAEVEAIKEDMVGEVRRAGGRVRPGTERK